MDTFSETIQSKPPKKGVFLGWRVIVACCFAWAPLGGFNFVTSMIFPFMMKEMHWTSADLGWILACGSWGGIIAGPVMGWVANRIGVRKSVLIGLTVAALGCLGYMITDQLWEVLVFKVFFVTFGGTLGLIVGLSSIPRRWFVKKGAFGLGIIHSNWALWFSVLFPLVGGLAGKVGWRHALLIMVPALWLMGVLATIFGIWNSPEEKGLHPDGMSDEEWNKQREENAARLAAAGHEQNMTAKEALRTPQFWLMALASMMSVEEIAVIQGNVTVMGLSVGMSSTQAGVIGSALMIPAIFSRAASAWLADHFGKKKVLSFVAVGSAVVLIYGYFGVHDPTSLIILAILCGLVMFCGTSIFPAMAGDLFGRKNIPQILGFVNGISTGLGGFVLLAFGYLSKSTGNWNLVYLLMAVLFFIQFVLITLIKPTQIAKSNMVKL